MEQFYKNLLLTRFKTKEELKNKLNNMLEEEIKVKEIAAKSCYDNDFQDYELIMILGKENEDLVDITLYYAKTRANENIIVETSYELL